MTKRDNQLSLTPHTQPVVAADSNVRLALLNCSGTGLFAVYNDRRDTTDFNPQATLGRSFIVTFTRLFDF